MKRALPIVLLACGCVTTCDPDAVANEISGITYSRAPAIYTKGWRITANEPLNVGGPVNIYTISPELPEGLLFDTEIGTIEGTPSELSPATPYAVQATNSKNSVETRLIITVEKGTIASGRAHNCALINGGIRCWGANSNGQLGDSSLTDRPVPVPAFGLTPGVSTVAAGGRHTCAVVNGGVQCWGSDSFGELGNGPTSGSSPVPVQVSGLASGGQAVAAGTYHACALVSGGVWCWGRGSVGQLGNNLTNNSSVPVQVSGLTSGVQAITAGSLHMCALVNGGVYCWGDNTYSQLGYDSSSMSSVSAPVPVPGLTSGVESVAAGGGHTCAVISGGVKCWGDNTLGQLGNALGGGPTPIQVSGLASGVEGIATGGQHTCALVNGGVQCWGGNTYGQLGKDPNSMASSSTPVQVSGLTPGVEGVAAGEGHTCALISGGVRCWGDNSYGQLGNNSLMNSHVPVESGPWE